MSKRKHAASVSHTDATVDVEELRTNRAKGLSMVGDRRTFVLEVADEDAPAGAQFGNVSYESLLAHGDPDFVRQLPADDWNAIALNYTPSTGKIQKFMLRERAKSASAID